MVYLMIDFLFCQQKSSLFRLNLTGSTNPKKYLLVGEIYLAVQLFLGGKRKSFSPSIGVSVKLCLQ